MGDFDAGFALIRHLESRGIRARLAWVLLSGGGLLDAGVNVIYQLTGIDNAIAVKISVAGEAFRYEVAEDAVAATELRPFDRRFPWLTGHEQKHVARRLSECLDLFIHRLTLNGSN